MKHVDALSRANVNLMTTSEELIKAQKELELYTVWSKNLQRLNTLYKDSRNHPSGQTRPNDLNSSKVK